MQRLTSVHPSDLTQFPSGGGKITLNASNEGSKILMYNETPLNIDLDFLNGKSDVLHAWEANFWTLDGDTKEIDWTIDTDSLNVVNPPINAVFLTLYDPSEQLRDKAYPMPLIRQIGGQQAIVSGSSTLVNTGNPINTTGIIQIAPAGDASNVTTLDNVGNFVNGDATHPGTVSLDNGNITSNGAGLLSVTGIALPNNVNVQSKDTGGTVRPLFRLNNSNIVVVEAGGANSVSLRDNANASITDFDSGGIHLNQGQLLLTDGAMKHFNGASTICGSATVITHGVGVTPRMIAGIPLIAQAGSTTFGCGNLTATTFTATIIAGTNLLWAAWHE